MTVLKQLDELIDQAEKFLNKSYVTLTGQLEDLRKEARYCLQQIGPTAEDALRAVSILEFNLSSDPSRHQESQIHCYENLAVLKKWLETVRDRIESGEKPGLDGARASKLPVHRISTPEGVQWQDVHIRFVSDHQLQIRIAEGAWHTRNYTEMGFEDRRTGLPDKSWQMLCKLAENGGSVENVTEAGVTEWRKVEKRMQKIRQCLREILGIDVDPFEPARKARGYKAKFRIECAESYRG